MKVLMAILLVVLMIGVRPAFATMDTISDQTIDPMAVKGKGIDIGAAYLIKEQNESMNISNVETSNKTTENISSIKKANATDIVMQSTSYNCGPAALATVLNNLGINATEKELANLAGTDESGTTMHGLMQAAQSKGLKATGMKVSMNELKKNDMVFLTVRGNTHYSVVKEVTNKSIKLADPSLGNIEMSKEEFAKVYSGNALVINDLNASIDNLSDSNGNESTINSNDLLDDKTLKNDQMQSIKGKDWIDDAKRFVEGVVAPIAKLFRPGVTINASANNSSWSFYMDAHAASKIQRSKKYKR